MKTKKMIKYIEKNSGWKINSIAIQFKSQVPGYTATYAHLKGKSFRKLIKEMFKKIHYM